MRVKLCKRAYLGNSFILVIVLFESDNVVLFLEFYFIILYYIASNGG